MTIDLSDTKSAPPEVHVEAYAIFRDVDVLVGAGTHVALGGGVLRGDLSNEVPPGGRRVVGVRGFCDDRGDG